MALQLLVSSLIVDVWDSGDFDTLTLRLLLICVLERILIKVDRSRSKTLRCRLLVVATELVGEAFEA